MSSDSGEKSSEAKRLIQTGMKPPDTDQPLQCPRCESLNTKFCYYNNYNLAQPRYFCKCCRRYWTRGGTLRNVPVGGGTRKSSSAVKRSKPISTFSSAIVSTLPTPSSSSTLTHHGVVSDMPVLNQEIGHQVNELNLNQAVSVDDPMVGLTGEFGLGLGVPGLGFQLSPWDWSMGGVVGGENSGPGCTSGGGMVVSGGGGACWQVENGLGDGEYYGWSDLAMSTPGNGVK